MGRDLRNGGERPDRQAAVGRLADTPEALAAGQADHRVGAEDAVVEAAQQVGATRVEASALGGGQADRLVDAPRADVLEARHGHDVAPSFRRSASRRLSVSGSIGLSVTRTPVAW